MNIEKDSLIRFGTLSMASDMSLVPLTVGNGKTEPLHEMTRHNPRHPAWFAHQGTTSGLFRKNSVTYEKGDFAELHTTNGAPAIGNLIALQDALHIQVQWMCSQQDVEASPLRALEQAQNVNIQPKEIFLTDRISSIPISEVNRKVEVWLAGTRKGSWFADIATPADNTGEDYLIRFQYNSSDGSFSPLTAINNSVEVLETPTGPKRTCFPTPNRTKGLCCKK